MTGTPQDAAFAFEWSVVDVGTLDAHAAAAVRERSEQARHELHTLEYGEIPSASELHLASSVPAPTIDIARSQPSPGLASPLIEEARLLRLRDDFKSLSDLHRRPVRVEEYATWREAFGRLERLPADERRAQRRETLRYYLEWAYVDESHFALHTGDGLDPRWHLEHPEAAWRDAFAHIERLWSRLVKTSEGAAGSSMLYTPYPFLIPAGRFQEAYYWDTCFGVDGLLATGRLEVACMQADNLLELIRRFGFVPNGNRDYYLSRSQPPLSARMIRRIVEAVLAAAPGADTASHVRRWLRERAVPLLERELVGFWSDPSTRFDARTGLHHHWDALDLERPERYAADDETALGRTFRDVRASAESGLDFTAMYHGRSNSNEISRFAPVMLNALLCGFALDLAWLARVAGMEPEAARFDALAGARRDAIDRHLWDEERGHYRHRHLDDAELRSEGVCFTTWAPLFANACSPAQAAAVRTSARVLEHAAGVASSTLDESPHQWDSTNGWAPAQVLAVQGLLNFGYVDDAKRLARTWLGANAGAFSRHAQLFERIDVDSGDLPHHRATQYPVQEGFLWTNASCAWMAVAVLGIGLREIGSPQGGVVSS